jgi:hypothetical protein
MQNALQMSFEYPTYRELGAAVRTTISRNARLTVCVAPSHERLTKNHEAEGLAVR